MDGRYQTDITGIGNEEEILAFEIMTHMRRLQTPCTVQIDEWIGIITESDNLLNKVRTRNFSLLGHVYRQTCALAEAILQGNAEWSGRGRRPRGMA